MPANTAVESEEAMLSAELMGLAGLTTWRLDRQGVAASWRLREILGVTGDEVFDREAFRNYLHPDDFGAVRATNDRLLSEGGSATIDLRLRDGDGWRRLRATQMTKKNADGEWVIFGLGQDLTELANARDAALSAEHQVRGLMEDARVARPPSETGAGRGPGGRVRDRPRGQAFLVLPGVRAAGRAADELRRDALGLHPPRGRPSGAHRAG